MVLPPLPTPWNIFNQRATPFWQESLGGNDEAHPLSLFVGRGAEVEELEGILYGAGHSSSRQAIAGAPGVGKTTLVKQFKARARANGYFTVDDFVALLPNDSPEGLFSRFLSVVYETILANRPMTAGNSAMEAAEQIARVAKVTTGGGWGASILGASASASRGRALTAPKDLLADGVRILSDLVALVRGADARGLVVHINNLETLTEADATASADLLRALRDPMLMHPGLHVVIAGTAEAVQAVVNAHPQVRTVFSTLVVPPMGVAEVHQLLAARYHHNRLDPLAPPIPPIDEASVTELYTLYRGDLRGLLKALDDGIRPSIRSAVMPGAGQPRVRPLTTADIRPTLQRRYASDLDALRERTRIDQLKAWGERDPAGARTQAELGALWSLRQASVSTALAFLVKEGYVLALPREGASRTSYVLSGTSRLIFG